MNVLKIPKISRFIIKIGLIFFAIFTCNLNVYAAQISLAGPSKLEVGQSKRYIVINKSNQNSWNVETEDNDEVISAKKKNKTTIECKGLNVGKAKLVVKDSQSGAKTYLNITVTSKGGNIFLDNAQNNLREQEKTTQNNTSTTKITQNNSNTQKNTQKNTQNSTSTTKTTTPSISKTAKTTQSTSGVKNTTQSTSNTTKTSQSQKTVQADKTEIVLGFSKNLKISNTGEWTFEQPKDGRVEATRSGSTINCKGMKKGTTYILVKETSTGKQTKYPITVLSNATSVRISKKPSSSMGPGNTFQFVAATSPVNYVGREECGTITWTSSDSSIISINSKTGQAELKKSGKAVITVTYSDGVHKEISSKTTVSVAKPKTNLKTTQKSHEDVIEGFSNEWTITSSNGWKYEVPNDGILQVTRNGDKLSYTALKQGQTTITVIEEGTGKTKKTKISVLPHVTEIEITNKNQIMKKGRKYTLKAKTKPKNFASKSGYGTITWTSSNTSIAKIDSKTGRVEIKKDGSFKITVTYNDGKHTKVTSTAEISTNTSSGSSGGNISGGSIVQVAEQIHTYMEQNNYGYITNVLAETFEGSKQYRSTCCATYVSWVLQKCGYISDSEHFDDCGTEEDLLLSKGWKKIDGTLSNLKPGDIIIYFSGGSRVHTDIYVGDGKKLNAGSDYSIRDIHYDTFNEYRAYNIYRPK